MPTIKNLSELIINNVESQEVYDYMVNQGLINDNELYLVNGEDTGAGDEGGITVDLLWENASPTSSFSSSINLGTTDYIGYIVICKVALTTTDDYLNSENNYVASGLIREGSNIPVAVYSFWYSATSSSSNTSTTMYMGFRTFTSTGDGVITCSTGKGFSWKPSGSVASTSSATMMVPYRVYGIK